MCLYKNNWQFFCTLCTEHCLIADCKNASSIVGIQSQSEKNIFICHSNIDWRFRSVHHILNLLTLPKIYYDLIKLLTRNSPVPDEIRNNKAFFPWFKDCIGAIDRTHIPMHVPEVECLAYWNRKGNLS